MNEFFSIIVPVRNAERMLPEQVRVLLDVLPDLASRFELILVDDGSTDQTLDVARDLARRYPQVRAVRHVGPRGASAAAGTGLAHAAGRTVFVHLAHDWPSPAEIRRFWAQRHEQAECSDLPVATRADVPHAMPPPPRGASFLGHLKRLALGTPVGPDF